MTKPIEMVGKKFNRLKVISFSHSDHRRHRFWNCECECGARLIADGTYLMSGEKKSCGCLTKEQHLNRRIPDSDFLGKKFNKLTILKRKDIKNIKAWICKCDCGNITTARHFDLIYGKKMSCGCLYIEKARRMGKNGLKDLTGKSFGRLKVLKRDANHEKHGYTQWLSQCQCGNIVVVRGSSLKNGSTQSCGCLFKEKAAKRLKKIRKEQGELIYKEDNIRVIAKRTRDLIKKAIKRKGYTKKSKAQEILGCEWVEFKKFLENQFSKKMNWSEFEKGNIHIDHIIPLASAKSEQEVLSLNHYTNLRPMWAKDNLKKGSKITQLI